MAEERTETLCDGCHYPLDDCMCEYFAACRAADGDPAGMEILGYTDQSIRDVMDGEIEPEEFLNG